MPNNDTIIAQATAPGRGSVGIVRVSGPNARKIAELILGDCPAPRQAMYLPFYSANKQDSQKQVVDQVVLWNFDHTFNRTV